jgi:hypothetical protein
MASVSTIKIEITTKTPFELKPKTEALTDLSKLDLEVLQKLSELSKSPKAISQLKNNFGMIKGFLG